MPIVGRAGRGSGGAPGMPGGAPTYSLHMSDATTAPDRVTMFGADWCRDCRRSKALLDTLGVDYEYVDVEQDLSAAIERLVHSRRDTRLSAVAQLGELRRRQGRQHEAEKLLQQAEFVPEARVSRALLALGRGDPDAAWRAIAEVLAEMPPAAQLDRAAVLPSAVVVALAADDPDAAACAAARRCCSRRSSSLPSPIWSGSG